MAWQVVVVTIAQLLVYMDVSRSMPLCDADYMLGYFHRVVPNVFKPLFSAGALPDLSDRSS